MAELIGDTENASVATACPGCSIRSGGAGAAGIGVDDLEAFIRVVGIAEHAPAAAIGCDVPALYSAMVRISRVVQGEAGARRAAIPATNICGRHAEPATARGPSRKDRQYVIHPFL